MIIDNDFKTQLSTAILTAPIVYIPYYYYAYVDQALCELLLTEDKTHDLFGIDKNQIYEYDLSCEKDIPFMENDGGNDLCALSEIFRQIADGSRFDEKKIFLLKGVAPYLEKPEILLPLMRFASLYESFVGDDKCITLILVDDTPLSLLPSALLPLLYPVEVPLPDPTMISKMVQDIPVSYSVSDEKNLRGKLVELFKGLDQYQIGRILRSTLIKTGNYLTTQVLQYVQHEKMKIIKKSGVLEVVETDVSIDMIGGLDVLRSDIKREARIFHNLDLAQSCCARVSLPKGILLLGMPGCGKSMIAKAVANEFAVPLLRLDIGRLMGQYVGLSEENLRKALATVEASHPCVLWIDEIEKAFAGSQSDRGQEDSLVVRLMGCFLTWMQERTSPVYIVATANDVMRQEFMRKGRFDEVYFVDFPKQTECERILEKKIEKYMKKNMMYDFAEVKRSITKIANMMQHNHYGGFSGAEIESVVNIVVRKKFIEYMDRFGLQVVGRISVHVNDFECVINSMKPSVMANLRGKNNQPTSIDRILEVQSVYHFRNASNV